MNEQRGAAAASDLTLDEKCRLLGGASSWRTHPVERAGVPVVRMSDGPNGVRGESVGSNMTPGVCVPVGIALGATWDPDLVGRIGDLLGKEAVRKGAHVLLAPTVNLQRTPVGGRVFECYSEDPELTARLAVEFVRGVQGNDVAVTVKHFVANDTEVERMTVDARVPERALRELYLRPFEAAVTEAGAWGIMSAYNRLAGEHCAGNRRLLTEILREEWGFDGFVVSDWFGSHDTVASANAGLTVAMPGPKTIYGEALARAVGAGGVDEATVDALVHDLLRLVDRTRARELSADRPEQTVDDADERALCRRTATEGMVLLRNERSALPLSTGASLAVIGPNAASTRIMGGGSASLAALPHQSILEAVGDIHDGAVTFEPGVRIDKLPPPLKASQLRTPDGSAGLLVEYRNGTSFEGDVAADDVSPTTMLRWFGSTPAGVEADAFTVTARGTLVPDVSGPHLVSATITGAGRVTVGDTAVLDDPERTLPRGSLFFGQAAEEQVTTVDLEAGVPVEVTIQSTGRSGFCGVRLGARPVDPPDLLERAVAVARDADVAVVVVGTNDEWETEGEDRDTIALPGEQDALVRAVVAANPNTVVVVNAGSPVSMPWLDEVAAVLVAYFGGEEMGPAVAEVLTGAADPGGRLPITYPRRLEDTPAWPHYAPVDGVQRYGEGLLMGYRGFDAAGTEPLFPFGHGLSYGTTEWGDAELSATEATAGDDVTVTVPVTATGERSVTEVVQVYLGSVDSPVERAPKELAAFRKAVIPAGETATVELVVPGRAFRRWDEQAGAWVIDPGTYELLVARSATNIEQTHPITIKP